MCRLKRFFSLLPIVVSRSGIALGGGDDCCTRKEEGRKAPLNVSFMIHYLAASQNPPYLNKLKFKEELDNGNFGVTARIRNLGVD